MGLDGKETKEEVQVHLQVNAILATTICVYTLFG
ncbi:uncharacterized protein G2W53_037221 [Senna tora]|uniref:Uncharacterized protein n=1 Tax=Senna tora TaxID=362788 RepID=A0A834SVV5_9FABA|nr:uncharacterized protein G2W53_037221 [Senna tora]